jgi:hypothetical protein
VVKGVSHLSSLPCNSTIFNSLFASGENIELQQGTPEVEEKGAGNPSKYMTGLLNQTAVPPERPILPLLPGLTFKKVFLFYFGLNVFCQFEARAREFGMAYTSTAVPVFQAERLHVRFIGLNCIAQKERNTEPKICTTMTRIVLMLKNLPKSSSLRSNFFLKWVFLNI